MLHQCTILKQASVTGIGVHSGKKVSLTLYPAEADFGIRFKRVDRPKMPIIKASVETVGATENNTSIGTGENSILTVEHLLSVFYGLGINNVYCEVEGPEIPIMDGSGASFLFFLKEVGIAPLNKFKKTLIVTKPVEVKIEDKWSRIEPADNFVIDSTIAFTHPVIQTQKKVFEFSYQNYIEEISRARTFGMLKDISMLKRRGFAKGGSIKNVIILDDFKVINPEGLRYKDEFVRHKIFDMIGDFSLLGHKIAGKITSFKPGHHLNNLLCRELLKNPQSYEVVSASLMRHEPSDTPPELPRELNLA